MESCLKACFSTSQFAPETSGVFRKTVVGEFKGYWRAVTDSMLQKNIPEELAALVSFLCVEKFLIECLLGGTIKKLRMACHNQYLRHGPTAVQFSESISAVGSSIMLFNR